jgi:molybdopterin molybdotransferase
MALTPLSVVQAEVLELVTSQTQPAATELPVAEARGMVLAQSVRAKVSVPPFRTTAMDGFAVRAADLVRSDAQLAVIGTVPAGRPPELVIEPGQAARIMTGAPMPEGADSVAIVEVCSTSETPAGQLLRVAGPVTIGDHVRYAGEDVAAGETVFEAGTELGPAHLGVLSSLGLDRVPVWRRPRVGVLVSGDELLTPPQPLRPGQIYDSNRPALLATLAADGFTPIDLGKLADQADDSEEALLAATGRCDAILTTGGVSMGDFDFLKSTLARLGGESHRQYQIAIRPAKPFSFSLVNHVPIFGLPGNPVSCLVAYELLARPALRAMAGHLRRFRPRLRARCGEPMWRQPDGKVHYLRAVATVRPDGSLEVASSGGQNSNQLSSLARANALVVLPDGPGASFGDWVEVLLFGPLG